MFKEQLFKEALRAYAGQHVLDRVIAMGRDAFVLGAERRHLTVMWVDTRGVGGPVSDLAPEKAYASIQNHLRRVLDYVEQTEGIVDSFVGDAVIAYWGTRGSSNHALRALDCAARILRGANPAQEGIKPIIGVDTGNVSLGNAGTPERIKYTLMGDVVNLASRLGDRCSQYGVQVLFSETVLTHAGDAAPPNRVIDSVQIKGRDGLTDISTLADIRGI